MRYPTVEQVIEFNKIVLEEIKVKKADKPELLSKFKLEESINNCKKVKGNVYGKAACLLKNIVQAHAFASGNRRTAFLTIKIFLKENGSKLLVKDDEKQSKVLIGVREGFYSQKDIIKWLRTGEIHEFKR